MTSFRFWGIVQKKPAPMLSFGYLNFSYGASNGYFRSWISATLDHDRTTKLYHTWFSRASTRWLDIALYKAMERITKAVNLDDLTTPVTGLVTLSIKCLLCKNAQSRFP